jgi:Fe-S-cluster-containing dehydrogenase component
MKRLPIQGRPSAPKPGESVWVQSPDELTNPEAFDDKRVSEFEERGFEPPPGVDRRTFMTLMGASMALGGLAAGCRRPDERILPYTKRPEDLVDGKPVYYATSMPSFGSAIGLLVKSTDGRPTKVEGNPAHPSSLGGTTAFEQASVLDLYDPDRSRSPKRRATAGAEHTDATAEDAWAYLGDLGRNLRARKGKGFALLLEEHRSPTTANAIAALVRDMPQARLYRFEPFGRELARQAHEDVLGRPADVSLELWKADVVVVLDADILGVEASPVKNSKAFAKRRRPESEVAMLGGVAMPMSRWYVAEPSPTTTGMGADHRLRIQGRRVVDLAKALAAALAGAGVTVAPEAAAGPEAKLSEKEQKWVAAAAKDLQASNGAGAIVAGQRQPMAVHAIVAAMNAALGFVGNAVNYVPPLDIVAEGLGSLNELTQELNSGGIDSVIILGGNPVFSAPADIPFEAALAKAKDSVHFSSHFDETSRVCAWHVPRAHYLESWSDTAAVDGTLAIVQPLIAPIWGGRTDAEVLERLVGGMRTPYELVQATWGAILGPTNFDKAFRSVLHDGLLTQEEEAAHPGALKTKQQGEVPEGAPPTGLLPPPDAPDQDLEERIDALRQPAEDAEKKARQNPFEAQKLGGAFNGGNAAKVIAAHQAPAGEFEVLFAPDPHAYDGRYANNGWLMELPDPIHKTTWGSYASISAATAKKLGVVSGDHLEVAVGTRSVQIPAIISYGHADDSVTLPVGLGRKLEGRICKGVGVSTSGVRSGAGWYIAGGTVKKAGGFTRPAVTQGHFMMEGRPLIRTQTVTQLKEDPKWASELVHYPGKGKPEGENNQLFEEWKYDGHKWAMFIDLTLCTGCSACVTACQSENNIPILGVDAVLRSREMHWIRIDRYFEGKHDVVTDGDEANAANMPMTCQHCENAPCEQVCPVAATTHSPEGINEMTYNRCIGTKYCGNNCPFKVRRFNYFNYTKEIPDVQKLVLNPDVTVRSRGVMEKCTYCVQRVNQAKISAKKVRPSSGAVATATDAEKKAAMVEANEEKLRIIRSFTSACAQACPTEAITFGDLNDKAERDPAEHGNRLTVAQLSGLGRAYKMLEEINVRPRTTYLARIRNPNPELEPPAPPDSKKAQPAAESKGGH